MKSYRNNTIVLTELDKIQYERRLYLPGTPVKWMTVEDITNKIILGDVKLSALLPLDFIDLLIVDPPYNLSKKFGPITFKKMSDVDYIKYLRTLFSNIMPSLKKTASIYVCCDWKTSPLVYLVLNEFFIIQNRITWQREKGRGALENWKNGMEDIYFATVSKKYTFNVESVKLKKRVLAPYKENGIPKDWKETEDGKFRLTYPSNFWDDITIPFWSMPENTEHPTQKSEKLMAKIILASSNEGDFIFDPFLGTGAAMVTAAKLNRKYSGFEINKEYCLITEKRLEMALRDKTIQGYDGVFYERNSVIKRSE